ncbi:nitroreductase [Marivirga sp. S37H4]|uniref:Putative NAD(P)H nitroreductase n=1 Tax=Marivirga aurantiaca TaxID=2802615 RepID=A0A934X1U7_9BACT|nr:nitroreductase [Marivirga aurantiaca]MBK6267139.1 nitroreductase [Marivirga aurantiaca]
MIKPFDISEINRLIKSRRSIFPAQYSGEKVPDEIVEQMLENAKWAPTHKHTEPWQFTVFTGEGLRKLGEFQSQIYKEHAEKQDNFSEEKFLTLQNKPLQASHIIAIAMKRDEKGTVPEIEEIESVACAVQNMYLTATAYGIGCYWGSGGITYLESAKESFGLSSKDKLLGFLYLGMPKDGFWPEGKRTSMEDKVHWVKD